MNRNQIVKEYRADRGHQAGSAIYHKEELADWRTDRNEAGGWQSGCLRVDEPRNQFMAAIGDEYSGAKCWQAQE